MSELGLKLDLREMAGHCRMCGNQSGGESACPVCSFISCSDAEDCRQARPENCDLKFDDVFRMLLRFGIYSFRRYRHSDEAHRKELVRLTSLRDWPKNDHGFSACCCCGYHTLDEAPASHEICDVCGWQDSGIDWNMYWWDTGNGISLREGRANFDKHGTAYPGENASGREPVSAELPRHDWAADDRPFCRPPIGLFVLEQWASARFWEFIERRSLTQIAAHRDTDGAWVEPEQQAPDWFNLPCPVCGAFIFAESGYESFDLCPICSWQDDIDALGPESENEHSGAKCEALREARHAFARALDTEDVDSQFLNSGEPRLNWLSGRIETF